MKKLSFFPILVLFTLSVKGQIVNIPDTNFKNVLVNTLCVETTGDNVPDEDVDTNNDGEIQVSEAEAVTRMIIEDASVLSMEGMQAFSGLEFLGCQYTQITSLNISGMTSLQYFGCGDNPQLTQIDLGGLPNLSRIFIVNSNFHEIDASETAFSEGSFQGNPELVSLNIRNGVISPCYILTAEGYDYTCSMFLNCPSLQTVCVDEGEGGFSLAPQENVQFIANAECTMGIAKNSASHFTVYPNPAKNLLTIEPQDHSAIDSVILYNLLGQKVASQTTVSGNTILMDMTAVQTGSYLLEITSDEGRVIKKIIKQ